MTNETLLPTIYAAPFGYDVHEAAEDRGLPFLRMEAGGSGAGYVLSIDEDMMGGWDYDEITDGDSDYRDFLEVIDEFE